MFPNTLRARQNTAPEAFIDDPPDEHGAEMAREARVWKTYVRESDKLDKEMVDGRNSSLDVLLIFAALFSAISTAFVIESLGDLKPDPAESSAQTLLVMSQILATIANNQPVASPSPDTLDPPPFSPSRTAVVVNMLWLLSLSLSVAVSLVAMLSKEWCFKFMSGRSGPSYDQARKRQRKWNGMERWKMKKALIYLSAMMHLALLLFALGLCLYLWDVNRRVALPVIVITGSATFVYICATIFPAVDRFCPYTTPAIEIIADAKTLLTTVFRGMSHAMATIKLKSIKPFCAGISFLCDRGDSLFLRGMGSLNTNFTEIIGLVLNLPGPGWLWGILCFPCILFLGGCWNIVLLLYLLLSALLSLFKWLLLAPPLYAYSHVVEPAIPMIKVVSTAVRAIVDFGDKADDRYGDVIMDTVTSQMLAWLIANCEDSRSVDTALQAIAGAHNDLPHGPLVECGTLDLVRPRLEACLKSNDNPSTVLRYHLTYGILMSGGAFRANMDRWYRYYAITDNQFVSRDSDDHWRSYLTYANLLDQAYLSRFDSSAHASVAIVTMPFCHWKDTYRLEASRQREVVEMANLILRQHLQPGKGVLSAITLPRLVESTAHYLVGVWPREESFNRSSILPILLARIFLAYHDTIPDVACGAAVTLAATAFATRTYAGGEEPSDNDDDAREKRAVKVLKYYEVHTPDRDGTLALFVFGFFGILPELRLLDENTRVVALPSHFNEVMQRMPLLDFDRRTEIQTLPRNYSLRETVFVPALRSLSSVASGEPSPDQAATVFNCLPLLIHRPSHSDPKIYVLALMALFHANCVELRDLCLNIIDAQPIPGPPMNLLESPEDGNLLERLCRTLVETNTPVVPIAALHFELLIASIITYPSGYHPVIEQRQSALQSLLNFRNRFPSLGDPSPLNSEDPFPRLKSETEGSRQGSLLRAMQSIVDFCEAGMTAPAGNSKVIGLDELQKWKDNCKPSTARIVLPLPAEGGSSSPGQSGSSSNAGPPDTAQGTK